MAFDGQWRDALQYMCDCYKQIIIQFCGWEVTRMEEV